MWSGIVPYRIEIFTWFAILGRLNTRMKLASLGIISIEESVIPSEPTKRSYSIEIVMVD